MSRARLVFILFVVGVLSGVLSAAAVWMLNKNSAGERFAQAPVVPDFSLLDQSGRYHRLYQNHGASAVVLYSYQRSCRHADVSLSRLLELQENYRAKGLRFFAVNGSLPSERGSRAEQTELSAPGITVLKDDSQLVSQTLGFFAGGEALLVDPKSWRVHYRGPIDGTSVKDTRATDRVPYLKNAIESILNDEPVAVPIVSGSKCLTRFTDNFYRQSISYNRRIVPILKEKCIACHHAGGIAPWSMDSNSTLKLWASSMRQVLLTKTMPPWHADPDVGDFAHDRSLTVAERQDLIHWLDSGAANDEEEDGLVDPLIVVAEEWPLGKPDLVIDLPSQKLPAKAVIPYRWVKVPVPVKTDTWVRAVQLKPSNASVMHHGFVFVKYPQRLKASEPRWLEGRNGFFSAFVPGMNVLALPEGSGKLLPAGATLIFQLHYVTKGVETADNPKLALYFHDRPPQAEYKMVSAANMAIRIPPHAVEHQEKAEMVIEEDGLLQGFYPHMHYRGKWFRYDAIYPDGTLETLLSVPNYDIHWQTFYRLKIPKLLPRGTRIIVNAAFDNSANNPVNPDPSQEVKWGLKSSDEMLVGYLMYTRERE